jgi:hypothetical protein
VICCITPRTVCTGDEYQSQQAGQGVSLPLNRLLQIAKLLNVDDLEDVVDLIGSSKRKGNWDLKLDDAKALESALSLKAIT